MTSNRGTEKYHERRQDRAKIGEKAEIRCDKWAFRAKF